jgi:hypothetical protein
MKSRILFQRYFYGSCFKCKIQTNLSPCWFLISLFFLSWISPLLALGREKVIDENDLYEPISYEKTKYLTDELER